MQYNSYGELARLTLPTGGAYGYKYSEAYNGASDGVITLQGGAGYNIFRPLLERDEYSDGVNLSGKMQYSAAVTASGSRPATLGTAVFENNSGVALRTERHYFYGNPQSTGAPPPAGTYADWWQGLEYETDIVGSGSSQSVQRAYQQRPWASNESDQWFSTSADAEPLHDPQMCQANTRWTGARRPRWGTSMTNTTIQRTSSNTILERLPQLAAHLRRRTTGSGTRARNMRPGLTSTTARTY
jgi:hypothetical protein